MAANVYLKSLTLDGESWYKLAATSTVLTATIVMSSKNASAVDMRVNGGVITEWFAGATVTLVGVDISQIEVRGTSGDYVAVAGYTR